MLTITVIAQVKPLKRQEFLQVLNSLYFDKEGEKGLKKSMLYQEMNDPNSFRLIVELETRRNLEKHLGEEKFRVLRGALDVLCAQSQIQYSYTPEKGGQISGNRALIGEAASTFPEEHLGD